MNSGWTGDRSPNPQPELDPDPTDDVRTALAELQEALRLAHAGGHAIAVGARIDQLSALARDAPDNLVLRAVQITAAAVDAAARARTREAWNQVGISIDVLKMIAACPPEVVRGRA